jgi:hypothetical protein
MLPSHTWYGILPGGLIFYGMIAVALVLFGIRAVYLARLLFKGTAMPRWDQVPVRVGRVILYVFAQARLLANDFWPGLMHAVIFWGFVILTLGTIEFFGRGVTESFFLPLLSETAPYLILQDLFSALVILAVGYALFRRLVTRPKRLNFSTEALVILLLILGLMVTDLVADAAHMRLHPLPSNRWQFAGGAIADWLGGLSPAATTGLFHAAWWLHGATLLGFLVLLPYSKHLHILVSPLNVFFSPLEPKGQYRTVDL